MAKFEAELPNEIIKQFKELSNNCEEMLGEMTQAGAEVVYNNIQKNIQGKFKRPQNLLPYLKITKTYKTASDDGINTKVAFYGYKPKKNGTKFEITKTLKGGKKQTYEYDGTPVPLIIMAREYGTASGEDKKPFVRPSFKKAQITKAMLEVQKKYIKEDD